MAEKKEEQKGKPGDDGIDYKLEGSDPGEDESTDPTDEGYDEAAHTGKSRYAIPSGEGGVFGTTGGGGPAEGFQVITRPGLYDREGEPEEEFDPDRTHPKQEENFVQVNFENEPGGDTKKD